MFIFFFDFEILVASRAHHTASHHRQFAGTFGLSSDLHTTILLP